MGAYVAIGTAIVMAGWAMVARQSPQLGWDFPVFYIAARLPLKLIYNHAAFVAFAHRYLAPLGVPYFPPFYIRPSLFALLSRPIGIFGYWQAFAVWAGVGLFAYLVSVGILIRHFRLPAFLLPAYAAFFPAMAGLISGQDCCVFLFAIVADWLLLRARRDWLAGALLALCLYKFHLILLIPLMLLLHKRLRVLISFTVGAIVLAAWSVVLAPPRDYLNVLVNSPKLVAGYFPVGLLGFSAAIGQGWCYLPLAALAFVVCCWLMRRLPLTEAFCVAIVGTLLISPHVSWYDSTLLALPIAVVFARAGTAVRIICVAVLAAIPLWEHGGGNNGPIGFMHVGVELLLLGYFLQAAGIPPMRWRVQAQALPSRG